MAIVAEYKKKIVNDIVKLTREYPIIGIVNMEGLPAPQLQAMRSELRGKIDLFMTKKRFMKIALDKMKDEKKGIEQLSEKFEGMPAIIFTKENPFKLSKILQKSKTNAPAKAGQTAPDDIVVKAGPTPFAPGPIISELSDVGLKVGVEGGKVAENPNKKVTNKTQLDKSVKAATADETSNIKEGKKPITNETAKEKGKPGKNETPGKKPEANVPPVWKSNVNKFTINGKTTIDLNNYFFDKK